MLIRVMTMLTLYATMLIHTMMLLIIASALLVLEVTMHGAHESDFHVHTHIDRAHTVGGPCS